MTKKGILLKMAKHIKKSKFNKKNAIMDLLLLLGIIIIIASFYVTLIIRGQKSESVAENRALNQIPSFKFADFFSGDYQQKLEDSLIDQMVLSENVKKTIKQYEAQTVNSMQGALIKAFNYTEEDTQTIADNQGENNSEQTTQEEPKKEVRNIKYIPISGSVYRYGDSEYMVFKPRTLKDNKEKIDKMAEVYNEKFKGIDSYFYFVNISKSIDFNTVDETENEFVTYIRDVFDFKGVTGLKISSYEDYKNYFYQTDHHWNYKGSYQGYRDIIEMMLPGEELIEPTGTKTYDVYYYGSNARTTSIYTNKEKFTVYEYDLKDYDTKINGYYMRYDNQYLYENGNYSTEDGYNHYRAYYGGDYAEVIYEFNQPEKENLLIIAPSYSNANNNLIASHFNNTYVIDLRHYYNEFGKQFDPEEYCKKNNITKFLFMISVDHLTNGNFMLYD